MIRKSLLLGIALLALSGCARTSSEDATQASMSEARHDTLLARSSVPGAFVVGRALDVAGREAAHSAKVDSLPTQ